MATVQDNLSKTAAQVRSIVTLASKMNVKVIFGGSGIQFLQGVADQIHITFNKYSELEKLI